MTEKWCQGVCEVNLTEVMKAVTLTSHVDVFLSHHCAARTGDRAREVDHSMFSPSVIFYSEFRNIYPKLHISHRSGN